MKFCLTIREHFACIVFLSAYISHYIANAEISVILLCSSQPFTDAQFIMSVCVRLCCCIQEGVSALFCHLGAS